jgi:hypothetical protein
MFTQDSTSWVKVVDPYFPEGYYLDDQFISGTCDVPVCVKMDDSPISMDLVKYEPNGVRESPAFALDVQTSLVSAFHSVPIHGQIEITFNVFQDGGCSNPTPVEFIIHN